MLELDLSEFPVLESERLLLRELTMADAPALFAMRSDERVMEHIGRRRSTVLADAEELIAKITRDRQGNDAISWAVTLKHGKRI